MKQNPPLVRRSRMGGIRVFEELPSNAYLLLLWLCVLPSAHAGFPLHKGNIWQYASTDVMYPLPPLEMRVLGDTLLPNGKTYVRISGYVIGNNFLRQELFKVYAYDPLDSAEYVLFDFAAHPGDTLSTHLHGTRTVIMTGTYSPVTGGTPFLSFREMAGTGPGSYGFYDWTVQDSIGVTGVTIEPGNGWHLRGARIDGKIIGVIAGVTGPPTVTLPGSPILLQNFPNPFNPHTTIRISLPSGSPVLLEIFNTLGEQVATLIDSFLPPGVHDVPWDASRMPSGTYISRLQAGPTRSFQRMTLLK